LELTDPVYWDPATAIDYGAALLSTVAWVVAGTALILWARSIGTRRVAMPLLIAGLGTIASGIGNMLEDVVGIEAGEILFSWGGLIGVMAMLIAAALILTLSGPVRWSALFLVAFVAGSIFPDDGGQYLSGLALIGLGYFLIRIGGHQVHES
jgi:hypothetical protein